MKAIRIGTRKSNLALAQARIVADLLIAHNPQISVQICTFVTSGDKLYDANLALIGGKGLFLKEIEEALLSNEIDIAVHSMKDVPAEIPAGLTISCILEREEVNDVFISEKYNSIFNLPSGALIGSSSSRRKMQILALRDDLNVVPFRGNVNTRLAKLHDGQVDAIILALAGIKRLGLESHVKQVMSISQMLPAIGQGAIGVESREGDNAIDDILSKLNHANTFAEVAAERVFMKCVNGNCTTPIAAHAKHLNSREIEVMLGYAADANDVKMRYMSGVINLECAADKIKEMSLLLRDEK